MKMLAAWEREGMNDSIGFPLLRTAADQHVREGNGNRNNRANDAIQQQRSCALMYALLRSLGVLLSPSGLLLICLVLPMVACGEVCFSHPEIKDINGNILRVGSIERIAADGSPSTVVSGLCAPSGLALDADRNLYYGNVTYDAPRVQVELFKRTPAGSVTSYGTVVDTSTGRLPGDGEAAFQVVVSATGDLYYGHPQIKDINGNILRVGSIERIAADGRRSTVISGLCAPSGLALDANGNLYYGNVTYDAPRVQVELFKRTPAGSVTSYGTVVDTSTGWLPGRGEAAFQVVVAATGDLYYNHPQIEDINGNILRVGSIKRIAADGSRSTVVSGLCAPSGLALDANGSLYYANVIYDAPRVQVELFKRTTAGSVTSYGTVVDTTSTGWLPGYYGRYSAFHVVSDTRKYALVVGIDHYLNGQPTDLSSCVNDAEGINCRIRSSPQLWNATDITVLHDGDATHARIRDELNRLARIATADDIVFFYQSSHGGWTFGTHMATIWAYDQDYLDSELANDLALFPDGCTIVIVLDTCYSGGMAETMALGGSSIPPQWNFAQAVMSRMKDAMSSKSGDLEATSLGKPSIGWITACDWDQTSRAGQVYSLFTGYLLRGFHDGDANRDQRISFSELFDYTKPLTVASDANQVPQILDAAGVLCQVIAGVRSLASGMAYGGPLGARKSVWCSTRDASWFTQTNTTYSSLPAVQSAPIPDFGISQMESAFEGFGSISFWYKVSSQTNADFFDVDIDGTNLLHLSGEIPWTQYSTLLTTGRHVVCWSYVKDSSNTVASDCAWVGEVSWLPQDSDCDSIPDWWMQREFAHATGLSNDNSRASDDADGDGVDNASEYAADTDPNDRDSYLRVNVLSKASDGLTMQCQGGVTAWQLVERSTDLRHWTPFVTNVPPVSVIYPITVPTTESKQFYRLRVEE
ncbi:MAG: caspase family protein [Kiritimatiellae bacterium]|nr:caspase family protein [Kiritimatiellia bacterium]